MSPPRVDLIDPGIVTNRLYALNTVNRIFGAFLGSGSVFQWLKTTPFFFNRRTLTLLRLNLCM